MRFASLLRLLCLLTGLGLAGSVLAQDARTERRLRRAADMVRVDDFRGALGEYEAALRENPDSPSVYVARARLHALRDFHDQAATDLARAVELAPQDAEVRRARAEFWHARGDYERSLEDFDVALENAPRDLALRLRRAEVRLDAGDYPGSLADSDQVLAQDRRQDGARAMRALALTFLERGPEGLAELDRLVRQYPNNPNAYRFRSHGRAAVGQIDGAITDAMKTVQLAEPAERLEPQYRLAFLLFAAGNLTRALEVYEDRALRATATPTALIDRLAMALILHRLGRPTEAEPLLRASLVATEASPDPRAEIYRQIARVALGETDEQYLLVLAPDPLRDPEGYCLTRFFAAQIRLARDDLTGARAHLREAVLTGRRHLLEWQAARATLEAFLPPRDWLPIPGDDA